MAFARQSVSLIPDVYCIYEIPVAPNFSLTVNDLKVWTHLKNLTIPSLNNADVLLLVSTDVPEVLKMWKS